MVIANALLAVACALSVTCIVKFADPAVVGWPLIVPVPAANDNPVGSAPTVTAHVLPPVPPVAASVVE
jgi:hypothetical protein